MGKILSEIRGVFDDVTGRLRSVVAAYPGGIPTDVAVVVNDPLTGGISLSLAGAASPVSQVFTAAESRGDSITVGFGLADASFAYGAVYAAVYALPHTNYGVNSTGVLTQYLRMTNAQATPSQLGNLNTVWLAGYNDMRSGDSALRLNAWRGAFATGILLTLSKFSALRQFYNGGGGGVSSLGGR